MLFISYLLIIKCHKQELWSNQWDITNPLITSQIIRVRTMQHIQLKKPHKVTKKNIKKSFIESLLLKKNMRLSAFTVFPSIYFFPEVVATKNHRTSEAVSMYTADCLYTSNTLTLWNQTQVFHEVLLAYIRTTDNLEVVLLTLAKWRWSGNKQLSSTSSICFSSNYKNFTLTAI